MSYRYAGTQWQRATLKGLFTAGVSESLEGSFLTHTRPPPIRVHRRAPARTLSDIKKFSARFTCTVFSRKLYAPRVYNNT